VRGSRPQLGLVLEGAAVVASILLAFGIQALWDDRAETQREQSILADLKSEFEENGRRLRDQTAWHERQADAALELYAIAVGKRSRPERPVLDSLLEKSFLFAGSFNSADGVLQSVLASGEIALIRDDSLRHALGAWPGMLEDATEDEVWIWEDVQDRFIPFLLDRAPLATVLAFSSSPDQEALSGGAEVSYDQLFDDVVFLNFLVVRASNERSVARELRQAEDGIEEALRLISKSLVGSS